MASQTKVEPIRPAIPAVSAARRSQTESGARADRDGAEGPQSEDVLAGSGEVLDDDEDVSLDELMISDSNDSPEEQGPGDVREPAGDTELFAAAEESELEPESGALYRDEDDEASSRAAAAAAQEAAAQEAAAQRAALEAAELRAAAEAATARDVEVADDAGGEESLRALEGEAPPSGSERDTEVGSDPEAQPVLREGPRGADALGSSEAAGAGTGDGHSVAEATTPEETGASSVADGYSIEDEAPISEPPQTQRRDAPLPSFDIPLDARANARGLTEVQAPREARSSNRASNRPLAAPLPQLSEISEEDDDDAVTHIGLPVLETSGEYSIDAGDHDYPSDRGGFAVADPGIAAIAEYNPDLSPTDARRATTRVVQRIDPSQLEPPRHREMDTMPPAGRGGALSALGGWWSRASGHFASPSFGADANRRRLSWLAENAVRPVSWVLVGSGLGAVIMLTQVDTGARAAEESQSVRSLKQTPEAEASSKPMSLIERAEAGEGDALFKITNMPASERTSALTLALERGHQTQKLNEFNEFARSLDVKEPLPANLTVRYLGYATSPETMLPALANLSQWAGSRGPDLLYAIWEKAPGGARAAGLAQQLLHSEDQRSKATPSLKTVLDLRAATSCEDYLRVLPAVLRDGDQRCSATLRALKHSDGCGDDGQQDCYACLRESTLLDEALSAVEKRVPPQL